MWHRTVTALWISYCDRHLLVRITLEILLLSSFRVLTGPKILTLAALLTSVAFRIELCPGGLEMFYLLMKILSFVLSMKTLFD